MSPIDVLFPELNKGNAVSQEEPLFAGEMQAVGLPLPTIRDGFLSSSHYL